MAEIIRMPKLSDTMTEGVVSEWHKEIGDSVSAGDLLAEIETDKANMEFESYGDGILLHIGVEAGSAAPINSVLAVLGEKGEDVKAILAAEEAGAGEAATDKKEEPASKSESKVETVAATTSVASSDNGNVKASPLAKKMAQDQGIDLSGVTGTGPEGRVIKRDIEDFKGGSANAASGTSSSMIIPSGEDQVVPHSMMRKAIARRLTESKFQAPHFYLTMDIDMDQAIADRQALNLALSADGKKVSFNDLVMKACALGLRKNPKVNSQWTDTDIIYKSDINIGMAVAVDQGLVVPVITNADYKSLPTMAEEARGLARKAKDGKLQPNEMDGNTFTVSNLGMAGIESFTSIINSPSSCIMAVGAIRNEPVVKEGEIVVGNRMKVTLSCDHRAVDGAVGSDFLVTFKQIMENPLVYLATSGI